MKHTDYISSNVIKDWEKENSNLPTYLIHGCNCCQNMGGGIAKQIALKYPRVLYADTQFTGRRFGSYSKAIIEPNKVIINAYTQYYPGKARYSNDTIDIRLENIECFFRKFIEIEEEGIIYMPLIGSGLAGGNWTDIRRIFLKVLDNSNKQFYLKIGYYNKEWDNDSLSKFLDEEKIYDNLELNWEDSNLDW